MHLNTTHCKLIWGISKSIHMKCTQINREITACPRSHPVRERERKRERGIDKQTDRKTDRQTGRHTYRHTETETAR